MANEFKIKHGFISTGSGTVEGEVRITGAAYADNGSRVATRPWVTQFLTDNTYATTADITAAIDSLVDSAPGTLDTLNELAAAIGDDPNFATSISTSIAAKLPLTGGTMTGNITFTDDAEGIVWSRNTDGASIKFYNTADGDTDSRLEFHTNDNNNEYFRWTHGPSGGALYEVMKLMPTSSGSSRLTVSGDIYSGSNKIATETHVSSNYLSKFHDMTITLTGDVSGTGTFNNMGDVSFAVTVANDSHTHDDRYYTEQEVDTLLSGRLSTDGGNLNGDLVINEGNVRIIQDTSNIAQLTLGEDSSGNHVILEYDGTGSGDTNYFHLYSGLTSAGWAAKGSSLNMQPSTGKIGIGTTTFTEKFNVDGNVRFTGTISASGYNKSNWDTAYSTTQSLGSAAFESANTFAPASHNHNDLYYTKAEADNKYEDATARKKWYDINATGTQAKRYHIARVYYCPRHWDDTWQNIEFELLEEGYNASYVRYSLFGFYNGTNNQTLNLKVIDFRGLGTDTSRYNLFLGEHIDAGWEHSGQPVFYTDVYVDVSYYKGLTVKADTFGHTYQSSNPTAGAAITVFYENPDVEDITYTNVTKQNTFIGDDTMLWNSSNFSSTNIAQWNTAYGWGNHADEGYITTYTNNYLNAISWNSSNGVITLGREGLNSLTLDIDGRFKVFSEELLPARPEQAAPPDSYPLGLYLTDSESSAPYSWAFDAGIVWGIHPANSNNRHLQFISNYDGSELMMRMKNGTADEWRSWNHIATRSWVNSNTLNQSEGDARYLGINAKAADSNSLDGIDSSGFWQASGSWKPTSLNSMTRVIGITAESGASNFAIATGGGKMYPYTDGIFYQNEGAYAVLDTNSGFTKVAANERFAGAGKGNTHTAFDNLDQDPSLLGWTYYYGTDNSPHDGQQGGYKLRVGLGSDYGTNSGTAGHYAMEMLMPRTGQSGSGVGYLYMRQMESGNWDSWAKIKAGYADSAGSVAWSNVSGKPTIPTNNNQLTNGAGYITDGNTNWNNTYGFITASDSITGNAATATRLATARNIALTGDVTGNANFDGSGNITITTAVANDSHTHDSRYYTKSNSDSRFVNVTGDTITGDLHISGASLGVTSTAQGAEAFYVDGVNGRLFTISDDLSDSLFSVNTISGLPVIEAFADNTVKIGPFSNPVTIDSSGVLAIGGVTAATQTYVDTAITNLIGGAPGALDTLNELAAAINDNASYASSVTSALALKAPLASPALTGNPTAPTQATSNNSTRIATTAFVKAQGYVTTDTNYYLNGISRSGNVLTFSVNGATNQTYTFGSAAWAATGDFAAASHNHSAANITSGTLDGARLSGTYNISVSGSSTSSNRLNRDDNRTISPSEDSNGSMSFGFTSFQNDNSGPWADYLHLRSYTDSSGGRDNLLMFSKSDMEIRLWQQDYNSSDNYAEFRDVAFKDEIQVPAIKSNGSTPSLNTGISAAEVRSLIGAGTSSSDTNYYLSGASFNTSDGVLTLTVSGAANQGVDLDGRYLPLSGGSVSGNIIMTNTNPMISFVPSGTNDAAGIRFNYTNNDGVMEFWTSDDYSEPFVWRAYDIGLIGTGTYQEWMRLQSGTLTLSGNIVANQANIQSITSDGSIANDKGSYLHIGGWGVGRTDATAVLVNTAYRADILNSSRTFTIGNTGKNFNGSSNVSWTLAEIGAEAAGAAAAVDQRIEEEVLPAIPTDNSQLTNGAGYITSADGGNAQTLDGLDSSAFVRKGVGYMWTATGSNALSFRSQNTIESSSGDQAALEVFQDNAGEDAFMQFHVSSDYAVYFGLDGSTNDLAVGGWSMGANKYKIWHAGNDGSGSGLDADTVDGVHESTFMRRSANSNLVMNNYNITGVNHITINDSGFGEGIGWQNWLISDCPDDLSNAAGNLQISSTAAPEIRVTVDTNGNLYPSRDRQHFLGLETNRWQIVFCEILDSAGQHEKNLQNPEGEKSVGEYPTGTVLVWKDGKNIPCTEYADHMRMGVAVHGVASPLIQGAEPVLVTGPVKEGDYLITSRKEGHAEAISPELMRQQGLYDCVLGKALETADGESHLVKVWINI